MPSLKEGKKSTEWWTTIAAIAFAAAKAFGIINPDATQETVIQQSAETLPALANGLVSLADKNGTVLLVFGIAWAYMRYRSKLKAKVLK